VRSLPSTDGRVRKFPHPACGSVAPAVAIAPRPAPVVGALCGAAFGRRRYLREWQLWWAGNWLGSLCLTPMVMGGPFGATRPILRPSAPAAELVLIGCALLGMTTWCFPRARQSPCGPRFAVHHGADDSFGISPAAALECDVRGRVVLLAAYFASRGLGPFAAIREPRAGRSHAIVPRDSDGDSFHAVDRLLEIAKHGGSYAYQRRAVPQFH